MLKNIFILLLSLLSFCVANAEVKTFGNFKFDANTIQMTNTNGGLTLRPNGSGKVQLYNFGDVLSQTNTVDGITNKTFLDSTSYFADNIDATKRLQFQLSGITTASTITLTIPDESGTLVTEGGTQALLNKYLQNPNVQGYMIVGGTEREIRFYDDDTNYITVKATTELTDNTKTIDLSALPVVISAQLNCDGSSNVVNTYPTGAFTAVGNISSGACSVTIGTGFFSAAPHCVVSYNGALSTSVVNVGMTVSSATAGSVDCVGDAGGSSALAACSAYDVYVVCTGPR